MDTSSEKTPDVSAKVHGASMPVAAAEWMIDVHSVEGDSVHEPFCGTGTTLIACEKTNRICLGIEINPAYVDVIIQRYCNFTGANIEEIYNSAMQVVQKNS